MRVLVAGGTGLIGGHAALYLQTKGHEVCLAARKPPQVGSAVASLPYVELDYTAHSAPIPDLPKFDALVFAAGNDVRHVPQGADADAHWERANSSGVPRFFERMRSTGIRIAINIGSFYPQAAPDLVKTNAYIRSRKLADDGVRSLAGPNFRVMSINAPFVVGAVPGLNVAMFQYYTRYAEGQLAPMPRFAPGGGVNFMSTRSLSDAIGSALLKGECGHAYLVGDENLTFKEYFESFFKAVGDHEPLPVQDQEHPLLPDFAIPFGRGNTLYYEPNPRETALLGYRRNDVRPIIAEVAAQYRSMQQHAANKPASPAKKR